jgi:hypothetical protein
MTFRSNPKCISGVGHRDAPLQIDRLKDLLEESAMWRSPTKTRAALPSESGAKSGGGGVPPEAVGVSSDATSVLEDLETQV